MKSAHGSKILLLLCSILFLGPAFVNIVVNGDSEAEPEEAEGAEEAPKSPDEAEEDFATFDGINDWARDYPNCNPANNKYMSPVNIDTKSAIVVKGHPTLLVYSDSPPKNLYRLEYFHKDSKNAAIVDALSINNGKDEDRLVEATYISGLGDDSFRFFRNAFFLFGQKDMDFGKNRSLHQIDGHQFPMEIVIIFSHLSRKDDITQIHVMVNISEEDNPMFFPITEAIPPLLHSYTSKGVSIEFIAINSNVLQLKEDLETLLEQEKKDTIGKNVYLEGDQEVVETGSATYEERIVQKEEEIKTIGDSESVYEQAKHDLPLIVAQLEKYEQQIIESSKKKSSMEIEKTDAERRYNQKIESGEIFYGENDVDKEKVFDLQEELREIKSALNDLIRLKIDYTIRKERTIIQREAAHKILLDHGWDDNPKSNKYVTVEKRKIIVEQFRNQSMYKEKLKTLIAEDAKALMKYKTDYGEVHMDEPFQISWLLPNTGGYYAYNGSYPVPPCVKRTFVIVMEHPISISNTQLDIFRDSFNEGVTINNFHHDQLDITVPLIFPIGQRKIWFNRRNLQFMRDDGVHMASLERKRLKDLALNKTATANILSTRSYFFTTVTTLAVIVENKPRLF